MSKKQIPQFTKDFTTAKLIYHNVTGSKYKKPKRNKRIRWNTVIIKRLKKGPGFLPKRTRRRKYFIGTNLDWLKQD